MQFEEGTNSEQEENIKLAHGISEVNTYLYGLNAQR